MTQLRPEHYVGAVVVLVVVGGAVWWMRTYTPVTTPPNGSHLIREDIAIPTVFGQVLAKSGYTLVLQTQRGEMRVEVPPHTPVREGATQRDFAAIIVGSIVSLPGFEPGVSAPQEIVIIPPPPGR